MTKQGWHPVPFDLAAALGLLTRLPVQVDFARAQARGAASAWAWPVVGLVVGAAGAVAGGLALWLGAGPGEAAALALGAQMAVTGGLHEDGLADSADGLWGGHSQTRRLEIMKDSRIGTYGVLALLIVTLLRWTALSELLEAGAWTALLVAGALSRAPMAALMAALPNARGSGLAQSVGRPGGATVALGVAVALACGVVLLGAAGLWAALWVAGIGLAVGAVARAKIGGQTGDILGAAQQLAEAAVLTVAAAALRTG